MNTHNINFQEARRIVSAELQSFAFRELLPVLLGDEVMSRHGIKMTGGIETNSSYQPRVDATARNEFGTAAFRFGHSMVQVRSEIILHK